MSGPPMQAGAGNQEPGFVGFPYMPMPPGEIPQGHRQPFQYPAMGHGEVKLPLDSPGAQPFPPQHGMNIPPPGGYALPGFHQPTPPNQNHDKVLNYNFKVSCYM